MSKLHEGFTVLSALFLVNHFFIPILVRNSLNLGSGNRSSYHNSDSIPSSTTGNSWFLQAISSHSKAWSLFPRPVWIKQNSEALVSWFLAKSSNFFSSLNAASFCPDLAFSFGRLSLLFWNFLSQRSALLDRTSPDFPKHLYEPILRRGCHVSDRILPPLIWDSDSHH